MTDNRTVPKPARFIVTEKGRLERLTLETCHCQAKLEGLVFACPECGTVFGFFREPERQFRGRNVTR